MPYASQKQRKFLHAQHPQIAARWDAEEPQGKKRESAPKKRVLRKVKKRESAPKKREGLSKASPDGADLMTPARGRKALRSPHKASRRVLRKVTGT